MKNYYLGIDGGGTKTKFILADNKGNILASTTKSTCHYLQCGLTGVTKVMQEGLTSILEESQIKQEEIKRVAAAIAGYKDIPSDNEKIEDAVKKAFNNLEVHIYNDTANAIAGSLLGKDGIHVISGTGSIGILKQEDQEIRCAGWHHIFLGDEGSAYWIASKMIQEFTKQSDGRHPVDQLYTYLKEQLNLESDEDILTRTVIEWGFDRTKIASLATYAYALAELNTPSVINIYQEAAKELAEIYLALKAKSGLTEITASYSGGVFNSKEYLLAPLEALLKPAKINLVAPALEPDKGSIILAYAKDFPLTDEIVNNLKG